MWRTQKNQWENKYKLGKIIATFIIDQMGNILMYKELLKIRKKIQTTPCENRQII